MSNEELMERTAKLSLSVLELIERAGLDHERDFRVIAMALVSEAARSVAWGCFGKSTADFEKEIERWCAFLREGAEDTRNELLANYPTEGRQG